MAMLPFSPTPFFADKNRAFWRLQLLGWAGYALFRAVSTLANDQPWDILVPVLISAITGFSIFDDEDDDQRQAARAKKVEPAKPNPVAAIPQPDLLADARRKLQVIVGVSVGMSMMAIVYVFAKMMTASIMKLAPAAFH